MEAKNHTEDNFRQEQLDNIINALPGGVALYRLVNGDLELMYQSQGVGALSGRTPEEYNQLVSSSAWTSMHSDDAEKVKKAIIQAADGDGIVSLDYRVPHKNGSYVWINGSFRRAGMDNGYPVVHAVFTHMSQMQELYRELTAKSGELVIVSDNKTHELLYLNDAALQASKIKNNNYVGKKCYEFLLGEHEPCANCRAGKAPGTELPTQEMYIPQLGRYYLSQGRVVNWAGHEANIAYLKDVTANKKDQQQIAEILQNTACGVMLISSSWKDGKQEIAYMSEGVCELFERPSAEVLAGLQSDFTYCIYQDDIEKLWQISRKAQYETGHAEGNLRIMLPQGRIKWVHLDFKIVKHENVSPAIYVTLTDVNKQMCQEQELRDLISNVPGGMCLYRWDGTKLHPLVVSEQFSQFLGEDAYARMTRVEGLDYVNVHPNDREMLKQTILRAVNSASDSSSIVCTYRAFNARTRDYRWLRVQSNVVEQGDKTKLVYASYTDVTEESIATQKMRRRERALDTAAQAAGLWCWQYSPEKKQACFGPRARMDFALPEVLENYPQAWLEMGYIAEEYVEVYRNAVEQIDRGAAQVSFEAQEYFSDNTRHWAEFIFTRLPQTKDVPVMVVCTARLIDIKKSLINRYEVARQKIAFGEKNVLLYAIFDLASGSTQEYEISNTCQSLKNIYPTLEQAIGHAVKSVVGAADKKKLLALNNKDFLLEQYRQGNTTFSLEYRRVMPSGRILWVHNFLQIILEPNSGALLLFEYCDDIHGQKMSAEVLDAAIVYDYDRIGCVDFRLDVMTFFGGTGAAEAEETVSYEEYRQNYARERVEESSRQNYLDDSDMDRIIGQVAEDGLYTFSVKVTSREGTAGVIRYRFVPYDVDNKIYIFFRTDVTELLQNEEAKNAKMKEALDIAQQANNAKSEFLSSMSHDMRTPMNAIVGMCELALADESDTAQIHESLHAIQLSSSMLLSLINNILDMSRIESGKLKLNNEVFSITEELDKSEASYQVLAEAKKQKFVLRRNILHDKCCGDIARIHSAIDNIVNNAIKYTPEGGKISYYITEIESPKAGIGSYRFEISDNGIGMDEETQEHLFEAFYRSNNKVALRVEGTGLGLAITKAIVDLKGGTISLKSSKGEGSTFVVELPIPLADKDATLADQVLLTSPSQSHDLSKVSILLCEDNVINQKVAIRILEKAGAKVTLASDGLAGVELFENYPANTFNLILMDVRMPVMDGYAATRAIRSSKHPQAKTIPIIAMTANAFAEDRLKSREAGMNDHLAKPIVPTLLYDTILHYTADKSPKVRKKVLFVDDVELNITILTLSLHDEYEIFVARSGEEALKALAERPDIAAIITDIVMPGMGGIGLIKAIRANHDYDKLPIIANTQHGDAKQEEELRELGANEFLYKPTVPYLVQQKLKAALEKA